MTTLDPKIPCAPSIGPAQDIGYPNNAIAPNICAHTYYGLVQDFPYYLPTPYSASGLTFRGVGCPKFPRGGGDECPRAERPGIGAEGAFFEN